MTSCRHPSRTEVTAKKLSISLPSNLNLIPTHATLPKPPPALPPSDVTIITALRFNDRSIVKNRY